VQLKGLRHVLCLGAHADDIEIGCGGTLLRLIQENPGLVVRWSALSAPGERSAEALASAHAFLAQAGQADVRVEHFRESYFPFIGDEIKGYFDRLGTEADPDLVLTHWRGDAHQDHRMVGELTWNTFRNHLILEYEIPKWDGDLGRPNVFVPLTREVCQRKVDHLLSAFPSQQDKDWFTADVFWAMLRIRGMEARSPSGYAEAFHCSKLVLG
jgi:LmbE family N-acetylglucosaminyl deacetylase